MGGRNLHCFFETQKMIEDIINTYINNLRRLRENEAEFEHYVFKRSDDGKRDENQLNRQRIGVGLLNDLKVPDDYHIVKRLMEEELRQRTSKTENYEFDVIYLYYYLLSEFGVIEDIWDFAALKFDGTMDSDTGFETGFFLTYGAENLRQFLQNSSHKLKDKIYDKVIYEDAACSDKDGQAYKEQQKAYFGLKKPLDDDPGNYLWIREYTGFGASFSNWKRTTDLSNAWNAERYVRFSEYLGDEAEIEIAMKNYIKVSPQSWSAKNYKSLLRKEQIKRVIRKIFG
jgi:hypothetical protein